MDSTVEASVSTLEREGIQADGVLVLGKPHAALVLKVQSLQ